MLLKASMIKLIPDIESIVKTRKFVLKEAEFLDIEKYSNELQLGLETADKCFITKSHFTIKKDYYYIPAFQIVELGDKESSKDYIIRYSPKKDKSERDLYYDEDNNVFYDLPMVKVKGDKWEYANDVERASAGSINAGVFYLNIYKRESNIKINHKPYKMCVLPSSMSKGQYEHMVNDLLNIRYELIMENKKDAKQSLPIKWTNTLDEIESAVKAIRKPLVEINKSPKMRLWQEVRKVSANRIRKFNSKVMMELASSTGKSKYNAPKETEDTNIYENQMILYALETLEAYTKNFGNYVNQKLLFKKEKIRTEMQKLKDFYNVENLEQLRNIIINKDKSSFYDLMMRKDNDNVDEEGTIEVVISIARNSSNIDLKMYFAGGRFHTKGEGTWLGPQAGFSLDYKNYYGERLYYTILREDEDEYITIYGRKACFELETQDIRQHLLLYYSLMNSNYNSLEIQARVKISGYDSYDPLKGKQVYGSNGEPYPDTYEYNINAVQLISINGVIAEKILKNELALKKLFSNFGFIMNGEQILEQIDMLNKKLKSIETEINENEYRNKRIGELCSSLEKLRNLRFFKDVVPKKTSWKLTQIFANDRNYSKLYRTLRKLDKRLEFINILDSKNIVDITNKKADKLYEYWLLIKMLYILTNEQQWKLEEGSIPQLISRFLKSRGSNELEEIAFSLTHDGINQSNRLEMKLLYNHVFPNGKNPDFAFKIGVRRRISNRANEKWFYLDAKYRDYESMGEYYWYLDMNDVAIKKYINSFLDTEEKAVASFICHTDNRERYTYFGGFFNKLLAEKLTNYNEDNPQHKFGSFYFLPDNEENFITFTKLILEYHFMAEQLWRICWDCGSTNNDVKPKSTAGGNEKFHITCNNCHSFWVRNHCDSQGHELVKHAINGYHSETLKGDPWYVKCPKCDYVK